jgi:hypothetical protein
LKLNNKISTLYLSLVIFITILSCAENKKQNILEQNQEIIKEELTYSFGATEYGFDTTKYVLHKSGFYISKNGDIFQKNGVTTEDSAGIWREHIWLDSTMFFKNNETKKSLKSIIDIESFTDDSTSRFEKDKNHVYYAWGTTDGVRRFILDGADPKTFKSLAESYGKDKSHIFNGIEIIEKADLKTFHVINRDTARDKKHLYVRGEIIED